MMTLVGPRGDAANYMYAMPQKGHAVRFINQLEAIPRLNNVRKRW